MLRLKSESLGPNLAFLAINMTTQKFNLNYFKTL